MLHFQKMFNTPKGPASVATRDTYPLIELQKYTTPYIMLFHLNTI